MQGFEVKDIVLVLAIFVVLGIIIVPLPPFILDIFITINITSAVILLGTSLFLHRPIDLSILPTVILMTALFRLALNLASTRMILSQGEAGSVIKTFGNLVAANNLIVGFIMFIVITVVQFLVITKGAERIAEVSARFNLDSMPGKQMAIDGELNMGLITPDVAKQRRGDLEKENAFFGSMDGASKFVKNDAIAGIIMTIVNVIGGLMIGVLDKGYGLGFAAQKYVILSVGDALGAQVPALLSALATGIIVTRSTSSGDSLSTEAISQFMRNPIAMLMSGIMVVAIGFLPGMPKILFLPIGLGVSAVGVMGLRQSQVQEVQEIEEQMQEQTEPPKSPEQMYGLLGVDQLSLHVGSNLLELADPNAGGTLIEDIGSLRQEMTMQLGYILPPCRVCDSRQVGPYEYRIYVRGNAVASSEIYPQRYMILKRDWDRRFKQPPSKALNGWEPVRQEPAYWVQPEILENLIKEGKWNAPYATAIRVLTYHLMETVLQHIEELMTKVDVRKTLDRVRNMDPSLVDNVVPNLLSISELRRILINLVREKVSIRDIHYILERLEDMSMNARDPDLLSEKIRGNLARQISAQVARNKKIHALTLSPDVEQTLEDSMQRVEDKFVLGLDPNTARAFMSRLSDHVQKAQSKIGRKPIVVCSPGVRLPLARLLMTFDSQIKVLSYVELAPEYKVESVGTVGMQALDTGKQGAQALEQSPAQTQEQAAALQSGG